LDKQLIQENYINISLAHPLSYERGLPRAELNVI